VGFSKICVDFARSLCKDNNSVTWWLTNRNILLSLGNLSRILTVFVEMPQFI
jgi:hypothetical protein